MLSFDTVHALTECLLHVQHDTPPAPPAAPELLGTVVLAQDYTLGLTDWRLRQVRALQMPLLGDRRHHHTLPAALHQVADALAPDPDAATGGSVLADDGPLHPDDLDVLRHALHERRPGLRLLAWAVCYDDLLADTDELTVLRRVEAVDVDGRVYQLSLRPGETHPVVLIDEHPDPGDLPATHPALAQLATAAQPAQT